MQETREFVITGFLAEQTLYLSQPRESYCVGYFPAILVHEDEPGFSAGRTAVHRLLARNENVLFSAVMKRWATLNYFYGIYGRDEIYSWEPMALYINEELLFMYAMVAVCALTLMTATGAGIAQAMESRLARRREEIGMLRAVGATRRQIRKIFGREAWLLALILSPLSVAGGCMFVWALSLIVPETVVFRLNIMLLLPVVLFSALCILVSASLPLRRASRIYPMSVIRDTELLRKSRSIRAKKQFKAPRLISARQLRLYPTRQFGATLLVIVMLLCVALAGGWVLPLLMQQTGSRSDFTMGCYWGVGNSEFVETMPGTVITLQDINQIQAIDHVERIEYTSEQEILLLMELDEVPEYAYQMDWMRDNWHLKEDRQGTTAANGENQYQILRELYDIDRDVVMATLLIADAQTVSKLAASVAEGKVDMAAMNAGREALVLAPDIYIYRYEDGSEYTSYGAPSEKWEEPWTERYENELFRAGDTLDMLQLYEFMDYGDDSQQNTDENHYRRIYEEAEHTEASVRIGAVVETWDRKVTERYIPAPSIVITWEGAQAMGLFINSPDMSIWLDGDVDEETEAYIEKRLQSIAVRGEDIRVFNAIENARKSRQESGGMILLLLCAAVVFCAVAVSMISGNIRRRVQADQRMIGTLRAVGADKKALVGCYGGQIEASVITGLIAGLAAYGMLVRMWWLTNPTMARTLEIPVVVAVIVAFAGACYLACRFSLGRSIDGVMKKSIVENIKEL